MKKILLTLALIAAFSISTAVGQDFSSQQTDLTSDPDTTTVIDSTADFLNDTTGQDSLGGPKILMRTYDHKQQVIVGSVVMLCISLILVSMNNYNPRR